jgi:hypothetical protein
MYLDHHRKQKSLVYFSLSLHQKNRATTVGNKGKYCHDYSDHKEVLD